MEHNYHTDKPKDILHKHNENDQHNQQHQHHHETEHGHNQHAKTENEHHHLAIHQHHGHHKHHVHLDQHIIGTAENNEKPKNPLKIYEAQISEDYYALCWCALKKEIWKDKYVYGEKIFLTKENYVRLIIDFIVFAILIGFTITIMLYQTFTEGVFKYGNLRIEILRILIVGFAQKLLSPEYSKGATKFRYVIRHPEEFDYPFLAGFIPFFQILMCLVSYLLIVIFMCVSNEALPLVMHFAEVAILIELDDWLGEMICKEFPDEGEKPHDVITDNLNEEMSLHMKLSLIREDLQIIIDYNIDYESCFLKYSTKVLEYFPWYILPFVSTLALEFVLQYLRPKMIQPVKQE